MQNADGEPTIFLGADSWDSELLYDSEDAEVEGSFFSGHFSPNTDEPTARAFVDTYESIYDATPTGGVGVSYDAVKLLFEAVERAGSLDPERIREQLAATENYIGATTGRQLRRKPTSHQKCGNLHHQKRRKAVPQAGQSLKVVGTLRSSQFISDYSGSCIGSFHVCLVSGV